MFLFLFVPYEEFWKLISVTTVYHRTHHNKKTLASDTSCSNGCQFFLNGSHKPFKRLQIFCEQIAQAVRTAANFSEQITQAVRMAANFFWMDNTSHSNGCHFFSARITQAVRMDAIFFWMGDERVVNGIPFKNLKLLVYVFPWAVTFFTRLECLFWVNTCTCTVVRCSLNSCCHYVLINLLCRVLIV